MHRPTSRPSLVAGLLLIASSSGAARAVPEMTEARALYLRFCMPCHGATGAGDGPAAPLLWPRPRDFTRDEFKWRSTSIGRRPTDADLLRVLERGVPGTSMPGWRNELSVEQLRGLIAYLKTISPALRQPMGRAVAIAAQPKGFAETREVIERGRSAFRKMQCDSCHGAELRGDGTAAANLVDGRQRKNPPYDLTIRPPAGGAELEDLVRTLTTGVAGTAMPSYAGSVTADEMWALAAYLRTRIALDSRKVDGVGVAPEAVAAFAAIDDEWPMWHGLDKSEAAVLDPPKPQILPKTPLTPAETSLAPDQCGRCHAKQFREWSNSIHARAMGPGVWSRFFNMDRDDVNDCQCCHAPLAEQLPAQGPFAPVTADRAAGITCAGCHVRNYHRYGPPRNSAAGRITPPRYPLTELSLFERADFCLPCHQQGPDNTPNSRPFLNTYREWLEGPYFRRGFVCQNCHMPDREHTWKGAHDLETVRQGIHIEAQAYTVGGQLIGRVRIENSGTGHYFPTTQTPAAFVKIWAVDPEGQPIVGSSVRHRIGRLMKYDEKAKSLLNVEDTRIPTGEAVTFNYLRSVGAGARLHVEIEWRPDALYESFYVERLAEHPSTPERLAYEQALAHTRSNAAVLYRAEIDPSASASQPAHPSDPGRGP